MVLVTGERGGPARAVVRLRAVTAAVVGRLNADRLSLPAALVFALGFSLLAMAPGLRADSVQDDVRQWGVWLIRLRDGELLRDDLIAAYYQATAPLGFTGLYWTLSRIVDPLQATKLLPPLLGLAVAWFTYLLTQRMHPSRVGAFLAAVLASWYAWQYDDLASGTPRAFSLPLLAALGWALASHRLWLAAALVVLAGLFYPSAGLLGLALLAACLVRFEAGRPRLVRARSAWLPLAAATALLAAVLLVQQQASAPYGPVVSLETARAMPEFQANGRSVFFVDDPYSYWLRSPRSGFDLLVKDVTTGLPILYGYLALATLLPTLWLLRWPPAIGRLQPASGLLVRLLGVSLGLFLLAHLLLFKLYLPNRYVKTSVPLVLAIAAGLALGLLLEAFAGRIAPARRGLVAGGLALGLGLLLALWPADHGDSFRRDPQPRISAYLRAQPKDTLVAGLLGGDSVSVFAGRRMLVTREHALPYHSAYYDETQRRVNDLVAAFYAETPGETADFAARYGVDYFLVNRDAFRLTTFVDPAAVDPLSGQRRQNWEPFTSAIVERLSGTQRFALLDAVARCAVAVDGRMSLLPVSCVGRPAQASADPSRSRASDG